MKKFKTDAGAYIKPEIKVIEVERESENCVWINGRRCAKETSWDRIHDSWEEAHAYLTKRAEVNLEACRYRLQQAQGLAGNVKGMKKPQES